MSTQTVTGQAKGSFFSRHPPTVVFLIIHDLLLVVPRFPLRLKLQCFQACAVGADDRTRGLLFLRHPSMEVRGEIIGFSLVHRIK